jgi:MFS family permease
LHRKDISTLSPYQNLITKMQTTARAKEKLTSAQLTAGATGFVSLFSLIGIMFYGLPFFYDFWVKDFGWSRATVTSGAAVGRIVMACFAFLAGWMIDKYGPRKMIITGILLGGGGLILMGTMNSLFQFYVFNLIAAAGYIAGGPLPNQVLMSRWFKSARGKAMGIAYLGVGIGGMFVPQITRALGVHFSWQQTISILGLLMIVIAIPFVWFTKDKPAEMTIREKEQQAPVSLRTILKTRAFYLLLIGSVCSIGAVSGTVQHLKLFFSLDLRFTQAMAANMLTLVLFSSIIGRLFMGWLADRIPKKYVMILIYTLVAGSIPLLYFATVPGVLYVFAILFGIGLGGDYMIIPLMAAELFGVRVMGRVMGVVLSADVMADALTPVLVGRLRDLGGNYTNAFAVLILLGITGIIAVLLLPKKSLVNE